MEQKDINNIEVKEIVITHPENLPEKNEKINPNITIKLIEEYKEKGLDLHELYYTKDITKRRQHERRQFRESEKAVSSTTFNSRTFHQTSLKSKEHKENLKEIKKEEIQTEKSVLEKKLKKLENEQQDKPQNLKANDKVNKPIENDLVDEKDFEKINIIDEQKISPDKKELRPFDEPVKKYVRLADQPKEDLINTDFHLNYAKQDPSYDPQADYAIEMINIRKTFNQGKIVANNGITLRVKRNEVHALMGENGAGKSVLMSILFGIYKPDEGNIFINREKVVLSSPMDATYIGLGMVHQHFKLVETNTIYQNVILGTEEINKIGVIKNKKSKERVAQLIEKYNLGLDLNEKVYKLNVAQQQKTEILKLLYREANIMIFDEPTAVLSDAEIKQFLKIIKQLKEEGKTIILITHKFNEIKEVADRATVIRNGCFVSDFNINEKKTNEMVQEMVGEDIDFVSNEQKGIYSDEVVLEVGELNILNNHNSADNISFKVHKGEIFAIAGITGNGQTELALMIAGLMKGHGKITINGKNVSKNIMKNYRNGLGFVPEDRHKHAVILDMPSYMNVVLDRIGDSPFSTGGILNMSYIKEHSRLFFKEFDVRGTTRGSTPIRNLSGGNQQKLVVGRELVKPHDLLVLVQPTRGLDLLAINNIHRRILEEKANGKAILLISYELDEILSLADTIAIMSKNKIVAVDSAKKITREDIGKFMVGGYEY